MVRREIPCYEFSHRTLCPYIVQGYFSIIFGTHVGLNRQKDGQTGVNRSEAAEGLSITRDDQLELILQWRNASAGSIYMRYFNAAYSCSIGGTAMNLTPQGQLAGGTPGENLKKISAPCTSHWRCWPSWFSSSST